MNDYKKMTDAIRLTCRTFAGNTAVQEAVIRQLRDAGEAIEELIAMAERYQRGMEQWADEAANIQSSKENEIARLNSELRDCRNELCLECGKYKRRHIGACDGCRWMEVGG